MKSIDGPISQDLMELLLMDPTFARDMSEKLPDDLLTDDVNKFLQLNLFQNFNNAGAPS